MTNLNRIFRENAHELNDGQPISKAVVYVRNDTLTNHQLQVLTKPNSLLKLPTNPKLISVNNPDVSLSNENALDKMEVCLAPFMVSSDFTLNYINQDFMDKFGNVSGIGNDSMSKVILPDGFNYRLIAYFEYFENIVYQTVLITIDKSLIDQAKLSITDINAKVLKFGDALDPDITHEWSIKDIEDSALLDAGFYYVPLNIPNRFLNRSINIELDLDADNDIFAKVVKSLHLRVTKNDVAPYTVINIPTPAPRSSVTRTLNTANLTSRIYDSKRYIHIQHIAGDTPVEVYIESTNSSNAMSMNLLTLNYGTYDDVSFIKTVATRTDSGSSKRYIQLRMRNARLVIRFITPLLANETFIVNSYEINPVEGIGARHVPELGTITDLGYGVRGAGLASENSGTFSISKYPLNVGECYSLNTHFYVINNPNALHGLRDNVDGFTWSAGPITSVGGESVTHKSANGSVLGTFNLTDKIIFYYENLTVERISGGIRVHRFDTAVSGSPAFNYIGFIDVMLDHFTADEPLWIIQPMYVTYSINDSVWRDVRAELSAKFTMDEDHTMLLDESQYDNVSLISPQDILLTDVYWSET